MFIKGDCDVLLLLKPESCLVASQEINAHRPAEGRKRKKEFSYANQ